MSRITSLGLKNFKSIGREKQEIKLGPITLLFGPNSAGKSTILQSLIYLREIVCQGNLNPDRTELGGSGVDLGGFKNLVHGHELDEAIELSAEIALGSEELPDYLNDFERDMLEEHGLPEISDFFSDVSSARVTVSLRWSRSLGQVVVDRYCCSINDAEIAELTASLDGRRINIERMPLALQRLQADLEAFPGSVSFAALLGDLMSGSVANQSAMQQSSERILQHESIDELAKLIQTTDLPPRQLLVSLRAELARRSSRSAYELRITVDGLLDRYEDAPALELIGLLNQKHALPDSKLGLEFDADIWSDQELDEENDSKTNFSQALQHLAMAVVNTAVCGPLHCLSEWLDELSYIGPLRALPPRHILPRSTPDRSRWASGLAAWELLPNAEPSLVDEINFWLGQNCLDSGYQLLVKKYRELEDRHPLYQILEKDVETEDLLLVKEMLDELPHRVRVCLKEDSGLEVMPQDIGVGISQLFPVIALSVIQKSGLAAIEQPELHIHPRLQVELADVFVRYAKNSNVMFLLETHSEHLMLRLLKRVRQGLEESPQSCLVTLEPDDLAVHYVEPTDRGTSFKQLRVTEDGDFLDEWPHGFFDERDEELFF